MKTSKPTHGHAPSNTAKEKPFASHLCVVDPVYQRMLHSDIDMGSAQPVRKKGAPGPSCQDQSCHPF